MTSRPALVAALVLATNMPAVTQTKAAQSDEQAIRSDDWRVRSNAFPSLIGVDRAVYNRGGVSNVGDFVRETLAPAGGMAADRRKRLLIELLSIENTTVNGKEELRTRLGLAELPPVDRFSEAYLNYYADVIAAVAGLSDVRSIDALVGAMTTGEMARGPLISFGPVAVAPVTAKMANSSDQVRSSAAFTLTQMLIRSIGIANDAASRQLISDALRSGARDKSYVVRRRVVEGLVELGDADSIAIVKEMARTDPYTYPTEYKEREGRYPVREAADAALKSKGIK